MSNIYIQEPPTHGKVLLTTSVGDIDIELWSKETPKACRNFIQLLMEGYYDGIIFHRVVKGFIVQGGDPTGTGEGGESIYGAPFKDEIHSRLRFVRRGLVAMANGGPNDNGSQFFFTFGAAPELNKKHTIFGKVVGNTLFNMLKLEEVDTDANDRPSFPHKIIKGEILANPFDDIIPRTLKRRKSEGDDMKKPKSKSKATKNFNLLSFGEEAEEDEEETNKASKTMRGKSKSSHDLIDDPRLSSTPAVEDKLESKKRKSGGETEESDAGSDTKESFAENVRKKLKKEEPDRKKEAESGEKRKEERKKEESDGESRRKERKKEDDREDRRKEEKRSDSSLDEKKKEERKRSESDHEEKKDEKRKDGSDRDDKKNEKNDRQRMHGDRKDDRKKAESDKEDRKDDKKKVDSDREDKHDRKDDRKKVDSDREDKKEDKKKADSDREDRKDKHDKKEDRKKVDSDREDKKEDRKKNDKDPEKNKSSRSEELRREARKLQKELADAKKKNMKRTEEKTDASKVDSKDVKSEKAAKEVKKDTEPEMMAKVDMLEEYKQERQKYKELRQKQGKKGSSREAETLAMLAKFQNKLQSVRKIAGEYEEETTKEEEEQEAEEDNTDVSWMSHKLQFEDQSRKVLDANVHDADRYEIYDPRNPLTKRRREDSKKSSRDRR